MSGCKKIRKTGKRMNEITFKRSFFLDNEESCFENEKISQNVVFKFVENTSFET